MIRAAILMALVPSASIACDFNGSIVSAVTVPGGMDVTLRNRLVATDYLTTCVIDLDGADVVVQWDHKPGNKPDEITVTPPPGYIASPQVSTVPENETAIVAIREWSGM